MITAMSQLFPTLADRLNPEQLDAWRSACRNLNHERVKEALMHWYRTEDGWPVLGRIVARSRTDYGANVSASYRRPELTDADRAAYKPGLARMREILEAKAVPR